MIDARGGGARRPVFADERRKMTALIEETLARVRGGPLGGDSHAGGARAGSRQRRCPSAAQAPSHASAADAPVARSYPAPVDQLPTGLAAPSVTPALPPRRRRGGARRAIARHHRRAAVSSGERRGGAALTFTRNRWQTRARRGRGAPGARRVEPELIDVVIARVPCLGADSRSTESPFRPTRSTLSYAGTARSPRDADGRRIRSEARGRLVLGGRVDRREPRPPRPGARPSLRPRPLRPIRRRPATSFAGVLMPVAPSTHPARLRGRRLPEHARVPAAPATLTGPGRRQPAGGHPPLRPIMTSDPYGHTNLQTF